MLSASMPQSSKDPDRAAKGAGPPDESWAVPAWQNQVGMCGLLAVLVLLGVRYALLVQPRAMEFDQICTLLTASARSWRAYIAAVPADSQPPFSHIAARLGLLLPLPQPIGLHLVSALAIAVAAVCLFRLFQRRGAPLAGLCAAALFTSSRCMEYMFTLRPYAALLSISAVSLLVYDAYRGHREAGRRTTLWPLALVIVLAATIHALSLVSVLLPIFAGEMLYWIQTRRFDKRLLVAAALASTAFIFDFTLARQIQTHYMSLVPLSARTPGLPTSAKLWEVLTIPVERRWQALLLVAVTTATLLLWRKRDAKLGPAPSMIRGRLYPLVAALALYASGVVAFAMGALNHYFFPRYASPVFLCGPLLLGSALSTAPWRRLPRVLLLIAAVLFLLPLPALRAFLRDASSRSPREEYAGIFKHGKVVASPLAFPTLWWYATPQERRQMQIITDPYRYRTLPDGIPEAVLQQFAAAGVLPFVLTPSSEFHPTDQVYLVSPSVSGDTWLPAALKGQGFRCQPAPDFHSQAYALQLCQPERSQLR